MNLPVDREFLSQVVIVTAVCAGAWFMLVQPKSAELARLEQQMSKGGEVSAFATPQGIETLAVKLESFNGGLDDIRRRNAVAEDTSALYGTIMSLAGRHSVRVQAVQPSPLKETSRQSPIKAARLTINVQGQFDDVARFLDDMAGVDAFIRPTALQLTPTDGAGEGAVNVHFGCDVLAFDSDSVLRGATKRAAATGGNANDQS